MYCIVDVAELWSTLQYGRISVVMGMIGEPIQKLLFSMVDTQL
jgi:hypothetical protein